MSESADPAQEAEKLTSMAPLEWSEARIDAPEWSLPTGERRERAGSDQAVSGATRLPSQSLGAERMPALLLRHRIEREKALV